MNLAQLHRKLIAAARKTPPDDRVPYAFEKRVLARLTSASATPKTDEWTLWARAFWYGAGAGIAVALAMSVWSFLPSRDLDAGFFRELEQTILASAGEDNIW